MKRFIKLNDNYSHLSLGNIIGLIKDLSKNKTSAIQSEVFCALFNVEFINESTVNNYCIGARSIGNDYKQIYINLKIKFLKDNTTFIPIICNILTIISGTFYKTHDINIINSNIYLKDLCYKLYNIGKNDFYVPKDTIICFKNHLNNADYYNCFIEMLIFSVLDKKQPIYETDQTKYVVEMLLENTDISVFELQNFLLLELNEGINFSHSIRNLANNNNPYAYYKLASMEYKGEFTGSPRFSKAFEYYMKAAESNHPSACWMVGNMLLNKKAFTVTKQNETRAFKYFEKAFKLGSTAAINSLGICYKNGIGVDKDINKALSLFEEAASKNYAYAFNNLGLYYEKLGDNKSALSYYKKGADLGESYACNRVGEFLRKQNKAKEAFYYYQNALNSTINEICPWAYYNLAKYYYQSGNSECNIIMNHNTALDYYDKSNTLIESCIQGLYISYEKQDNKNIAKYKKLVEKHPEYTNKIKNEIEKHMARKKEIIIP